MESLERAATVGTLRDTFPSREGAESPVLMLEDVVRAAEHCVGLGVIDLGDRGTIVTWAAGPRVPDGTDWWSEARDLLRSPPPTSDHPFSGGLIGWLGYEAGRHHERMPTRGPGALPDIGLWRCDGSLWQPPAGDWRLAGTPRFQAEARAVLAAARQRPRHRARPPQPPINAPLQERAPSDPRARDQRARYQHAVERALAHIAAGDVYQVCVAWERLGAAPSDPVGAWLRLREANPATRGILLSTDDGWVLSNSPEVFLDIDAQDGGLVARSVPIKGTTPASTGPEGAQALWDSPKEQAELTMIVDLVRSDLGRVAAPGTVQAGPRSLRTCGDLIHAEQAVTARLAPGLDALDAVKAAFPPGSVTGAPKVRAMSLIAELEPCARGVYTGALGFFSDGGGARLSVAIRTAVIAGGICRTHLGAGIVADSDPSREWTETHAKGVAMHRALGV
jgi:anthranilate/para-aminobenzoate synthase component I